MLATPVLGGLWTWFMGVDVSWWAAFAGLVYTLLLIAQKLWQMKVPQTSVRVLRAIFAWAFARFA